MKTYPLFAFLISGILAGSSWAADEPIIDLELKPVQAHIAQVENDCREKVKNPIRQMKCGDEITKKYRQEGKLRGTEEYCEKRYLKLTFEELEKLFRTLRNQTNRARGSEVLMWEDELPGEVTREDLTIELFWVESRLAKMQKARTEEIRKALYKKTGHKTP